MVLEEFQEMGLPEQTAYLKDLLDYGTDPVALAALALHANMFLVGCKEPQAIHRATPYSSLARLALDADESADSRNGIVFQTLGYTDYKKGQLLQAEANLLIASNSTKLAVAGALWGDINNVKERKETARLCAGPDCNIDNITYGWHSNLTGRAYQERLTIKFTHPTLGDMEVPALSSRILTDIQLHASPQLIYSARQYDPLILDGFIDCVCVGDTEAWDVLTMPPLFATKLDCPTALSIPVNGTHLTSTVQARNYA